MKTNKEITGCLHGYPYSVPKGTSVKKCPPDGDGISLGYFVDDLSFIDKKTNGILYHDAYYYGIRVSPGDVAHPGNTPCLECGRTDLDLFTDHLCPNCHGPVR